MIFTKVIFVIKLLILAQFPLRNQGKEEPNFEIQLRDREIDEEKEDL